MLFCPFGPTKKKEKGNKVKEYITEKENSSIVFFTERFYRVMGILFRFVINYLLDAFIIFTLFLQSCNNNLRPVQMDIKSWGNTCYLLAVVP